MNETVDASHAQRRAEEIFRSNMISDSLVLKEGRLAPPISVQDPDGGVAGWFIGVTIDDRIVGFIQLDRELRFLRYSSFPQCAGSFDDCPASKSWLDADYVKQKAAQQAEPEDELFTPVLTYDRSPSRVVWAVPARKKDGQPKLIYVAGDYVYVKRATNGEPTTG